jgi:hypothetical protein
MASKRALTKSDLERVEIALDQVQPTEAHLKIKDVISAGEDFRKGFLFNDVSAVDLRTIMACMDIVKIWRPQLDENGNVVGTPEGNLDDPDELDRSAVQLAAMNVTISTILGQLDAVTNAAEEDLKYTEARLRNTIRAEKRKGGFEGDPTDKELIDLSITHERYVEAQNTMASCRELHSVVKAVYFSIQKLEERLNRRVITLLSQWGRSVNKRYGETQ